MKDRNNQGTNYTSQVSEYYKNSRETHEYPNNILKELYLTEDDVERIIHRAFDKAQQYILVVDMLQLLKSKSIYSLNDLNGFIKTILSEFPSRIVDITKNKESDYDSEEDDYEGDDNCFAAFEDEDQL